MNFVPPTGIEPPPVPNGTFGRVYLQNLKSFLPESENLETKFIFQSYS